jgi:predicted transcriptional regulator
MASALDWSSTKMLKEIPPHVLKQMDELKQIQLDIFAECREIT